MPIYNIESIQKLYHNRGIVSILTGAKIRDDFLAKKTNPGANIHGFPVRMKYLCRSC